VTTRDERDARERFQERYAAPTAGISTAIEQRVIGAAWGANGYTTVDQADELGRRLGLGPGRTLLDVGTGRGWPGLYLATETGCLLVGSDMPVDALAVAARRAVAERIDERVTLVAAAGEHQPFRPRSFDAIVHCDVLC
jgi:methylase of polypeptide subunit release factors